MVAAQLGLSTARIGTQARSLVAEGYLQKTGSTRPVYASGKNRSFQHGYPRARLVEDAVWYEGLPPLLRSTA
jgi:hypothetical protein